MKRLLVLALFSSLASLPLAAQHGGGGSHGGGAGGHAGGGGGSRSFSGGGGGMVSRPSGGVQRFSAPPSANRGGYPSYPSSAHFYGGGSGYRPAYGYSGARPGYAGNPRSGLRYPVRNPIHNPGQPYRGPYNSGYGRGYGYGAGYGYGLNGLAYGGWIGSDYLGYPDSLNYDNSNDAYNYGAAGYPPADDANSADGAGYGASPDDQSADQPGSQYGYSGSAEQDGLTPPPPPDNYGPGNAQGYAQSYPQGSGNQGRTGAPVVNERDEDLRSAEPVTLIYKDGRQPEQIRNYILSRNTLTILDRPRRVIAVGQLDLPATVRANRANGVEFHLPMLAQ